LAAVQHRAASFDLQPSRIISAFATVIVDKADRRYRRTVDSKLAAILLNVIVGEEIFS
jgi:hypothetical protein